MINKELLKNFVRKFMLTWLRNSAHIANSCHIGATREELLLRLEANSNLQYASTILVDPEDTSFLAERLVSSISEEQWEDLCEWYTDDDWNLPRKMIVPFPEDIADYWLIDRDGNDIEANCIAMIFDKMYNPSIPIQLLTLYPMRSKRFN